MSLHTFFSNILGWSPPSNRMLARHHQDDITFLGFCKYLFPIWLKKKSNWNLVFGKLLDVIGKIYGNLTEIQ